MTRITVTKEIDAPVESVFRTVAEVNRFSKAIPHIVRVEFLSEEKTGLGTHFRETRLMRGKEVSTVLEITEYVENALVRLVADSHGAVWDTTFTTVAANGHSKLVMVMDATPKTFMARLSLPLIKRMVAKAVDSDMEAVKTYCESNSL